MEPVNATPRMKSCDGSVNGAILEPASALGRPSSPVHEDRDVFIEVPDSLCLGYKRLDILCLNLLQNVDDILCSVLENRDDRTVPNWCVGAQKH